MFHSRRTTMIFSRFGTKLTLIDTDWDAGGNVRIRATTEGSTDMREYRRGDLVADDGMPEIDAALAKLPSRKARH